MHTCAHMHRHTHMRYVGSCFCSGKSQKKGPVGHCKAFSLITQMESVVMSTVLVTIIVDWWIMNKRKNLDFYQEIILGSRI